MSILDRASRLLGTTIVNADRLGGGSLSEIWRATLADGRTVVAKNGPAPRVEGAMLAALREGGAPAPAVLAGDDEVLVIEWLPSGGSIGAAWASLGRAVATLHTTQGTRYGWPEDYAFDSVPLVNEWTDEWPQFWGKQRLSGPGQSLPAAFARRLDRLAQDLTDRLPQRPAPTLLHGDLWGGNVLVTDGRVTGLVDPACYFGHAEVDLAMLSLFDSPSAAFFTGYGELEPGHGERLPIYQLWPAIVHARLFGAAYYGMLDRLLTAAGA